jgi:hypothetical protein
MKHRKYIQSNCKICSAEFKRRSDYKNHDHCISCANKLAGEKRKTHGKNNKNSRLHVIWNNMLNRCNNEKNKRFSKYGGRGIKVCKEWLDFSIFQKWALENNYSDNLTIDRIDNSKGYEPANCRFVDKSTQNANKRITDKNSTGYIGVSLSQKKYYRAYLSWKGQRIELGYYKTPILAALKRDRYIIENNLPHTLNFKELERGAA